MKRWFVLLTLLSVVFILSLIIYKSDSNTTMITPNENMATTTKSMLVAGGCFWCVEADLEKIPNVISAVSGYAGGTTDHPTYENYSAGGHREVVEVVYDEDKVSFREIAIFAIKHMDPTDGEGSFYDRGVAYGPALYYETAEEKTILEELIKDFNENGPYEKPLAVAILPRPQFWPAETYHQDYAKGALSGLKYQYYRQGSGRDAFIEKHWGENTDTTLLWENTKPTASTTSWLNYQKPDTSILKMQMDELAYKVTQDEGTEHAGTSPLDKNYEHGIYVDVLSGEPLFSSRDKYDSGTGWPSFTRPIRDNAVTTHEDKRLFTTRTEVRSRIADNHLGHVFSDGPIENGGLRYCMNGVALRFIPEAELESSGYSDYLKDLKI